MEKEDIDRLSNRIIGAAMEVHRVLGPGLLEQAYHKALLFELSAQSIEATSEVPIPMVYKGVSLDVAYRADLIVEDTIIVELKAVDQDQTVYYRQLLTYLSLSNKRLGLLINFNKELLRHGVHRVVNNL